MDIVLADVPWWGWYLAVGVVIHVLNVVTGGYMEVEFEGSGLPPWLNGLISFVLHGIAVALWLPMLLWIIFMRRL